LASSRRLPLISSKPRGAAPARVPGKARIDWSQGTVAPGGGVAACAANLRRTRGPNRKPAKDQVALRLDQEVVGALRASGPGCQTRVDAALKASRATQPVKR